MAVSNLLFPLLAREVWTASLLRIAAGAGHVGAYIPGVRLVSLRFAGSMRGTAVGTFVSIGFVGTTGSYAFMGWLLDVTGSWREAYLTTALVGLVGVAIALWVVRDRRSDDAVSGAPRSWGPDLRILRWLDTAAEPGLRAPHSRAISREVMAPTATGGRAGAKRAGTGRGGRASSDVVRGHVHDGQRGGVPWRDGVRPDGPVRIGCRAVFAVSGLFPSWWVWLIGAPVPVLIAGIRLRILYGG